MTGVGPLARLAFRRDRLALAVCVYVIVIMVAVNGYEFRKLYPTTAGRRSLAASSESNPAGGLWCGCAPSLCCSRWAACPGCAIATSARDGRRRHPRM